MRQQAHLNKVRPHALKAALPRTWGAFFRRYGNFTAAQLAAIPPVLAGDNVILCAPTASGKTEAALAPLIERYLPAERVTPGLTILYLLPTRALISDLWVRLRMPLETLRVSCAVKTHDFNTFDPKRPADLLLTTPESLDALMSNQTRLLAGVCAVVLDELHTFDSTVRGDQLRVLLNRLREMRAYAANADDATDAHVQLAALSATLSEPADVAGRFFENARVIQMTRLQTPGEQGSQGNLTSARAIEAELIALEADTVGALLDYLSTFRSRGWRKALAFCNTRAEVERYAAAIRNARSGGSPFGDAVYVHYSNLGWERRREIEQGFAQAEAALCFASSTLELGIDVGNIDVTLLIGPPGSTHSFVQRVGRANRRRKVSRVACFYRTPLERITFGALLEAAGGRPTIDHRPPTTEVPEEQDAKATSGFRPSVAVQQIFSLLKQSPTGAVRLNPLSRLFEGMLSTEDLRLLLGTLQALGYLTSGRPGEWRAGEGLNRLVDMQAAEYSTLSLHSNIEMGGAPIKIRDRDSQRVVASIDRQWFDGDILTLEGRPLNIEWYDGESLWVSVNRDNRLGESANAAYSAPLRYLSTRQALSYDLARRFPSQLGLSPGTAPLVPDLVPTGSRWLWFHWLGDVYGRAILDLLAYTLPVEPTSQVGLCLLFTDEPRSIPAFTAIQVERYLRDRYRAYEPMLALGAYHHLVPVELRRRAVVEQFDVPRFIRAVEGLRMDHASEALMEELHPLVVKD
ncbi:MAG: DEAD/DEAH box helicase [Chloroflexi bacterium]|nr:DEAD/DEAH box helicase [Chloroflexota bacterium]